MEQAGLQALVAALHQLLPLKSQSSSREATAAMEVRLFC